jgi:hypothetical protein
MIPIILSEVPVPGYQLFPSREIDAHEVGKVPAILDMLRLCWGDLRQ